MMLRAVGRDTKGSAALEFALTAPLFFALVFGVIEAGLMVWVKLGLQHGVEMAARCASVNTTLCGTVTQIQTYASQQSYGLDPPPSNFTVSVLACGNQVSGQYTYTFLTEFFPSESVSLTAQACFPT